MNYFKKFIIIQMEEIELNMVYYKLKRVLMETNMVLDLENRT